MIANSQQIVVDIFENHIRDIAVGRSSITQARTIMEILSRISSAYHETTMNCTRSKRTTYPRINNQQVHLQLLRLRPHALHKTNIITPIGTVILLFDMPLQPPVRICRMQEVDLPPLQRPTRQVRSVLRIRLHAPHIPRQHHIVLEWAIAAMPLISTRQCGGDKRCEHAQ